MTAERSKRKVRRDWAAILVDQAASGQTAGVYCREREIPYKSFLYHRRKHRAAEDAFRSRALEVSRHAFVPVEVSAARSRAVIRIFGVEVICEGLPDPAWLAGLVRQLAPEVNSC